MTPAQIVTALITALTTGTWKQPSVLAPIVGAGLSWLAAAIGIGGGGIATAVAVIAPMIAGLFISGADLVHKWLVSKHLIASGAAARALTQPTQ